MAEYQSVHDGETIDKAVSDIIEGKIDKAVKDAAASAGESQEAATQAKASAADARESVRAVEAAAVRQPYIGAGGTWLVWDAAAGEYRDTGMAAQGIQGPQGPQGIQGPQGEQGLQGVAGATITAGGFYGFEVSPEGMLSIVYEDGNTPPDIELAEDGHLYLTIGEETA